MGMQEPTLEALTPVAQAEQPEPAEADEQVSDEEAAAGNGEGDEGAATTLRELFLDAMKNGSVKLLTDSGEAAAPDGDDLQQKSETAMDMCLTYLMVTGGDSVFNAATDIARAASHGQVEAMQQGRKPTVADVLSLLAMFGARFADAAMVKALAEAKSDYAAAGKAAESSGD